MNRDRILVLAEHLERNVCDSEFDGQSFVSGGDIEDLKKHKCGTSGCIAGHAIALFGSATQPESSVPRDYCGEARKLLAIDEEDARRLFYYNCYSSRSDAVELLRAMTR